MEPLSEGLKVITAFGPRFRPGRPPPTAFASLAAVKRSHLAAAAALVLLVLPTTTGCFSGQGATTTTQATMNSGNGVSATQGAIHIENATLVLGPEGSSTATLLVRIVNAGVDPDRLTYATIGGSPAYITEGAGDLGPGASVSFGWNSEAWINSYGLTAAAATYVPVQLGFEKAGLVTMSLLVVPPVGYYEGIVPMPPTDPTGAVPSPSATPAA